MAYQPIENYGMIGNMRTVALVGLNGSIDWYCYPHFDSPSIFGALLDDRKGGRFQISSLAERLKSSQLYWPSTNILITRFLSVDGIADIEEEALTRAGQAFPERLDQARLFFEHILGYANHLGLYAEQTGSEGEALGNFPQAFTHFALISASFNLDRVLGSGRHC